MRWSVVLLALFASTFAQQLLAEERARSQPLPSNTRQVAIGVGKSLIVDVSRDIKDVLVADPKIANAIVRSMRRLYLIGAAIGQTDVTIFDADGQQIVAYDIAVTRDLNGIRAALKKQLPSAKIIADGIGEGIVLSGSVSSPLEAQQAVDLAARLAGGIDKVNNNITVRGRDQVLLKVTVAEVSRNIIKQLGVDLSSSVTAGGSTVTFNNENSFSAYGQTLANNSISGTYSSGSSSISATVRAMERAGVMRTLAEPNLTAISGESANFIAGGEFPVTAGASCQTSTSGSSSSSSQCAPSISFKKFGISLGFTPVVLSEGRISLKVATEVSEVSNENSITVQGVTVPSIKTRRADTVLEIASGGAMVMAGLIQQQTKLAVNGLPGLSQLPVLGTLFRSRDFVNNETELVVIVMPLIVKAVAQKDLARPDDGFVSSTDAEANLLGAINKAYGTSIPKGDSDHRGGIGFIFD